MGPKRKVYAYEVVYQSLKEAILNKDFETNQQLPSKRELARMFDVSINTIEHALFELEEEGYITCLERSGTYVSYQQDFFLESLDKEVLNIQKSSSHHNRSMSKKPLLATMRKVLSNHPDILFEKCDPKGLYELRYQISKYLKTSRNLNADPNQIIILSTSEEAYRLITILVGKSGIYGVEKPCYEAISNTYYLEGVKLVECPLGKNGIKDLSHLPELSVLHVTPYHSYPSNISASISKRLEYVDYAKKHDCYLVEDDFDSEFSSAKFYEPLYSLANNRVIYLNTFSHTVANGMRLNYMILPNDLLKKYEKIQPMRTNGVSIYLQLVMAELLASQTFVRHCNKIRRKQGA